MVKQDTPKTAPEPKTKRMNRSTAANAIVAAIEGKTTLGELAAKIDALVVKHGGKSNLPAASWQCRAALATAEAMGVVKLTRPTDILVERVKK